MCVSDHVCMACVRIVHSKRPHRVYMCVCVSHPCTQFCAIININLAIVNLLPLPALDGGYLLLLAVEALRGKKLPDKLEQVCVCVCATPCTCSRTYAYV